MPAGRWLCHPGRARHWGERACKALAASDPGPPRQVSAHACAAALGGRVCRALAAFDLAAGACIVLHTKAASRTVSDAHGEDEQMTEGAAWLTLAVA